MDDNFSDKETKQQKLVSQLASAIQAVYLKPRQLYLRSFLSGMFSALGATLGLAIIITVLGILVRHFGGLPVVGHWLTTLAGLLQKKSN